MPFTYPTSRATGYVVTATVWNSDVVSNAQWLGQDRPLALANETANQSIANTTITALTYTVADAYDTQAQHSVSSNTSRLTVGTGNTGLYFVHASGMWASNATGYRWVALRLNGTTELYRVTSPAVNGDVMGWQVSGFYRLTATTDYVEVICYQTSGGALNMVNATQTGRFGWQWVAA
jgi:hypothetical protein